MIVGCYTLHLYCAGPLCAPKHIPVYAKRSQWPAELTGGTEAAARREARARGWVFRNNDAYCKACAPLTYVTRVSVT